MPVLRLVPHGPPAARALRDAIIEAKGGDALAPVTIAVPSNYAGLSLRRRLGAGELTLAAATGRDGLVNVRFLVLPRVAELLGASALAALGLRPLTPPVRAEATRAALSADAGVFRDVSEHAATERSLELTYRELRQAPPEALDAVAGRSERAADVVRLFRDFRERTSRFYDEEDLALAAATAVRDGSSALRDVGHVILHLPRRISPAQRELLAALAGAGVLTVLVGLTRDAAADAPARRLTAQLEPALGAPSEDAPASQLFGTQVVAVTDPEEEVRTTLRLVAERLAAGTPLHRIAVLYPTAQPYALLTHEQFHAAGVPHNGPAVRTLGQTVSGRTLLGLLRLRERGLRRDELMDWLSAAPVLERADGHQAPAQRWDALSRSAGVVAGIEQWRMRLGQRRRSLDEERAGLERMDEVEEWKLQRIDFDIGYTERLAAFVDDLHSRLGTVPLGSWREFAGWGRGLLDRYLGGEGHRREWPDEEIESHRAVEGALDALSTLGEVREHIDEPTFRRALERELEAPATRIGRFGEGVFVGRIFDALGTDFDTAFVLGMTEGLMPPRGRDDPLLPDRERAAAGDDLPKRANRREEDRRDYFAALASARERVLVFPRADLRGQRGRLPARWLLETASQLEGRPLFAADLEKLTSPWFAAVPSFEAALAVTNGSRLEVASEQEYDLRSLLAWHRTGKKIAGHYLVEATPSLAAGLSADSSRQGRRFTRWDGRIEDAASLAPTAERAVSPTALQNFAACPFRYFLGHVLRIAETERPEDTLVLSPLERGNLIHKALERFVGEMEPRATADQPWTPGERERLLAITEELCQEAEASGVTGRPLLWRLERERICRDISGFLDSDETLRASRGVVPEAVELSFGIDGSPPLVLRLDDGRDVAFRGRIDRVDRAPDGSRAVVLDYKTGSDFRYRKLHEDPIKSGELLQLPVYGLAMQARFRLPQIDTYYWFVTERAGYGLAGYPLNEDRLARFRKAVEVIVDGIGQGTFPARPGASRSEGGNENCMFCPYDRVCPRDRSRVWTRKRLAQELRPYLDLAEPDD